MDIHALQPMTLLDYPGKVACTVFLGGCDLRCPFCHNGGLLDGSVSPEMDHLALLAFLNQRRTLLDGVCITGGEPLLHPELEMLCAQIKALSLPIKLDTNGTNPQRLQGLIQAGLVDYVAMDIKNSLPRYAQTVGLPQIDLTPICQSVALLQEGSVPYEFRTTVVKELHDQDSFSAIGPWLAGAPAYFLQSFVDREGVLCPGLHPCTPEDLHGFLEILRPFIPNVQLRG